QRNRRNVMQSATRKYRLTLTEPMLGTVVKDKAVYDEFIAERDRERGATDEQIQEGRENLPPKEEEDKPARVGKTGFYTDEKGTIFLFDYQIRGFLREAANTLAYQLDAKNL